MRKAILFVAVVGLSARCSPGQDHRLRVESARIGPDHRVHLHWTGRPEQVQAPGEKQTDIEDLRIAPDCSVAAWLVGRTDLSDASYTEAFELLVAWNGRPAQSIFPGRVISEWHFVDGGRRIAVWDETGHGGRFGKATLYDSPTGKLLAEWNPDSKKAPPAWAAPFHAKWENDSQYFKPLLWPCNRQYETSGDGSRLCAVRADETFRRCGSDRFRRTRWRHHLPVAD